MWSTNTSQRLFAGTHLWSTEKVPEREVRFSLKNNFHPLHFSFWRKNIPGRFEKLRIWVFQPRQEVRTLHLSFLWNQLAWPASGTAGELGLLRWLPSSSVLCDVISGIFSVFQGEKSTDPDSSSRFSTSSIVKPCFLQSPGEWGDLSWPHNGLSATKTIALWKLE